MFLIARQSFYFQGHFLYTYSYQGELYGLTLDAIETVAREGLACVVTMEIEVKKPKYHSLQDIIAVQKIPAFCVMC